MGTEQRSKSFSSLSPGPGQYNSLSFIGKAPKYSIASKSPVDHNKNMITPGPGVYSPNFNILYKNFSCSMSSRPNTSKSEVTPGPGNYNVRTDRSMQVPSYK